MTLPSAPGRPPPPPNDAFCAECGAPLPIDGRVCRWCGTLMVLGEHEKQHGQPSDGTPPPPAVEEAPTGKRPVKHPVLGPLLGLLVVAVFVVAVVVAVFGRGDAGTHTLSGTIILIDGGVTGQEMDCEPSPGYDHLGYGAAVLVLDQGGDTVAAGRITTEKTYLSGCTFGFTVADVPDRDTYRILVTHRNGRVWSRAELESQGWFVTLNVGDDIGEDLS